MGFYDLLPPDRPSGQPRRQSRPGRYQLLPPDRPQQQPPSGVFEDLIKPAWEGVKAAATPSTALRIGGPVAGGFYGGLKGAAIGATGGPIGAGVGAALGAAVGGGIGEYAAEKLEGVEDVDPGEIALAAGLSALPAGPIGRLTATPGLKWGTRAALHVGEGASQGILDTLATTGYRENRLPTMGEVGHGAVAGGTIGGILGSGLEALVRRGRITPYQAQRAMAAQRGEQLPLFPDAKPTGLPDAFETPPPDEPYKIPGTPPEEPGQMPLDFPRTPSEPPPPPPAPVPVVAVPPGPRSLGLDEPESGAAPEPTRPPQPAGMPAFVPRNVMQGLADLGWNEAQRNAMLPDAALRIVNAQVRPPSPGLPAIDRAEAELTAAYGADWRMVAPSQVLLDHGELLLARANREAELRAAAIPPQPLPPQRPTAQQGVGTVGRRARQMRDAEPIIANRPAPMQQEIERLDEARAQKLMAEQNVGQELAPKLRALGWDEQDMQVMNPDQAGNLVEHGIRKSGHPSLDAKLNAAFQDVRAMEQETPPRPPTEEPGPPPAPRPERPPSELAGPYHYRRGGVKNLAEADIDISTVPDVLQRQLRKYDDALPKAVKLVSDEHGVALPEEIKRLGQGAFHQVYEIGEATKGPYAGQKLVLRVGQLEGPVADRPWMVPLVEHYKAGGYVVDIMPYTYSYEDIGRNFAGFLADKAYLEKLIARDRGTGGGRFEEADLHGGNARYMADPAAPGGYRLVVSDFGAVIDPKWPQRDLAIAYQRQEPVGPLKVAREKAHLSEFYDKFKSTYPKGTAPEVVGKRFKLAVENTLVDGEDWDATMRLADEVAAEKAGGVQQRQTPKGTLAQQAAHRVYDTPQEARASAIQVAKEAFAERPAETHARSILADDPQDSPLRKVFRTLFVRAGEEAARGVKTLRSTLNQQFWDRGWVSLIGHNVDPRNPEASLALANRFNRAPFEVFHAYGVKDGRVVFHKAYTSRAARGIAIPEEAGRALYLELEGLYQRGEIDFYGDMHNHPGGDPHWSDADLQGSHDRAMKLRGYRGSVITNHDKYGFIQFKGAGKDYHPSKVEEGVFDFSPEDLQGIKDFTLKDPLFPTDIEGQDPGNLYKGIARLGKATFGDPDAPRLFALSNEGKIRAVTAVPMNTLADVEFMEAYLQDLTAREGGGFIVAYHTATDAKSGADYLEAAARLKEGGHLFDALVEIGEGKASLGVRQQKEPAVGDAIRVAQAPAPKLAAAKAKAEEVAQKGKAAIPPPHMPKGDLAGVGEAARKAPGPRPEEAKPGGNPDVWLNVKKNAVGLPDEHVKALVAQAKEIDDQLARGKTWHMDEEEMVRQASRFFEDKSPEEVVAAFKKAGRPLKSTEMRAAWMAWRNANAEATKLRDEWVAAGKPLEGAEREAWEKAVATSTGYGMFVANKKTEAARILKSLDMAMSGEIDPQLKFFGRLMAGLRQHGLKDKVVENLINVYKTHPEDFADALRVALKPSWGEKFLELWKAGLVSGPATHLANLTSNAIFRVVRDVENVIATGIDVARVAALGGERERFLGEATAAWAGYKAEMDAAWGLLRRENFGFKMSPLEGSVFETFEGDPVRGDLGKISGKKGELVRIPFKQLNVMDAFFKHLSAGQEVYRRAYRMAMKEAKAGKLDRSAVSKRMSEIAGEMMDVVKTKSDSPYYDKYLDQLKAIQDTYRRDTFQLPLEAFGRSLMALDSAGGPTSLFTNMLLPFKTTPGNIAKETVYRTPGAVLFKSYREKMAGFRKGGEAAGAAAEELAKTIMGSTVGLGVALAAYEGLFTGGGPADSRQEAALRETGWQPYSIKVGDQYVSYQRIEPMAGILGLAADLAEGVKSGDTTTGGQKAAKLVGAIQENLTNKTFLSGLEGFFTFWHDPQRYAKRFVTQLEASVVPNILGATARALDPNFRQTEIGASPIVAKIPGASRLLPSQKTPTGQDRKRPGTAVERFASPLSRTEVQTGPHAQVAAEMERVNFIPSSQTAYVTVGRKKVNLRESESQLLENARLKATAALARVVIDPTYMALPDNEGDPKWRYGRTTKRDVLEKVYRRHINQARQRINPAVFRRLRAANP